MYDVGLTFFIFMMAAGMFCFGFSLGHSFGKIRGEIEEARRRDPDAL